MDQLTWLDISKPALIHNVKQFRKILGTAQLMAVVKSNAYGHGLHLVSKSVEPYVDWFGTASLEEALLLRKVGKIKKPVLVLSYFSEQNIAEAIKNRISLPVYNINQARKISLAASKINKNASVHLKVDTGTSRLGIFPNQVDKFLNELLKLTNLKLEGLYSHLAASEDNTEFTKQQLETFNDVVLKVKAQGFNPLIHIACTASALAFPKQRFGMMRLGIGLYGLSSYKSKTATLKHYPNFNLKPALSWKTKIIDVKNLPANTYVGYGCTYKTTKPTVLAVLPMGYYEGYDRKFSNNGEVLIRGAKCPVIGRICMNLTLVDATKARHAKTGDEAVVIGKQGSEAITADEMAKKVNTINYEIVTRINSEVPRFLRNK